ncbi:hypothetical protein ACMFMG_011818 [Clarireedia jacksonii]
MAQEQCNTSSSSTSPANMANVILADRKRKFDDERTATMISKRPLHKDVPSQIDNICSRCASTILPKIISSNNIGSKKGTKLCDLGSSDTWLVAKCSLCKLLSAICPDGQNSSRYDLMAFPISVLFRKISYSHASKYLDQQRRQIFGVVPEGYPTTSAVSRKDATYLTLISPEIDPEKVYVRLLPEQINCDLLRTWISHCKNKHKKSCGALESKSLPNKRVIDCWKNSVIIAPRGKYVALSYVWGRPLAERAETGRQEGGSWKPPSLGCQQLVSLPSDLPTVISGAMDVTRGLGYRFLWVDKYCIDYDNAEETEDQIQAMELIYGRAELTICAAFGTHHNSGLPRVNTAIQKPQSSAIIHGIQFATTLSHPSPNVMKSKWATRGWTYQEAVLSPRRLFFTEEQTYFVCNAMECQESIHVLPDNLYRARTNRLAGDIMLFQPYSSRKRDHFSNFMEHVREYTNRNLTKQTDSLCAFLGIVRKFESSSPPMNNFLGLPVVSGKAVECFAHALTWIHDRRYNSTPIVRRRGFPSYSFVGWRGTASMQTRKKANKPALKEFHVKDVDIQVQSVDGEVWRLEDINKITYVEGMSQSSLKLRIEAPVLSPDIWCKITKDDLQGDNTRNALHFQVTMQMSTGNVECRAEVSGRMSVSEFLDGMKRRDLDCLLLGFVKQFLPGGYHYFAMIAKHIAGQNTERVGILSFIISEQGQVLELVKERRCFRFDSSIKI